MVFPNSWNRYFGSIYSSSQTTGNFERFIAEDLVAYIDENYRTIADREKPGVSLATPWEAMERLASA
uniref:CAZy families CE1 protein n=1 Tax=uncultured Caulobacter sp. TaxID=158749 RepID=A0A060CH79_9CAUL|nr:CAZy families CE1 protein [uncultured Caulobacter sp.]